MLPDNRLPLSLYWDWMRYIVASGGLAQYQMNQAVRVIVQSGIPIHEIDEFQCKLTYPSNWTKLTKTFFADRVVDNNDAHIKAFAGEMLTAVVAFFF